MTVSGVAAPGDDGMAFHDPLVARRQGRTSGVHSPLNYADGVSNFAIDRLI
jgi:hypothetical protein